MKIDGENRLIPIDLKRDYSADNFTAWYDLLSRTIISNPFDLATDKCVPYANWYKLRHAYKEYCGFYKLDLACLQ